MKNFAVVQKILILGLLLALCASTFEGVMARQVAGPVTLQDLITAAPPDGTVNIPAGTYSETLWVDKNLTLIGVSPILTILQPPTGLSQRVIKVTTGHNLTLQNLRVTGGHPTTSGDDGGGGIYLKNGNLILDNVTIDKNQASYGGGVFQEGVLGSVNANNSLISENTASFQGGGIYTAGSATLTNTTLTYNNAGNDGGGLHVQTGDGSAAFQLPGS